MSRCVNRFLFPTLLLYLGFLILGSLAGLAIGLYLGAIIISVVIGFFIGLALAIIFNAVVLIIANKVCFKNEPHDC